MTAAARRPAPDPRCAEVEELVRACAAGRLGIEEANRRLVALLDPAPGDVAACGWRLDRILRTARTNLARGLAEARAELESSR